MAENKQTNLKALWALLCRSASVDQTSNQLSLFNIIEEISVSKTPNPITPLSKISEFPQKTQIKFDNTLVVLFERDIPENLPNFNPYMEIKITDPIGESLLKNELPLKFEDGKPRTRVIIILDSILVTKSGEYVITVSARNAPAEPLKEKAVIKINIKVYE